jgi:hypothetical protein
MTSESTDDDKTSTTSRPMSLPVTSCCAATVQATCCEPSEKTDCCAKAALDECGCL